MKEIKQPYKYLQFIQCRVHILTELLQYLYAETRTFVCLHMNEPSKSSIESTSKFKLKNILSL